METFAEYAKARKRADAINDSGKDEDLDALAIWRGDRILMQRGNPGARGRGNRN
jgi:hypothetical protein